MTSVARTERPGAVWAAPALLFFGLFGLAPVVIVACLSLTSWNGLGTPEWVGLDNWRALPEDPHVGPGLLTTLALTVLTWATQTPLALMFGAWAAGPQRVRAVAGAVFFLPLLLSTAAIALVWQALLDPNFGVSAQIGPYIGLVDGNVLGDRSLALYAIVFVLLWQFLPFHMLLYQAAARQIPASLYEAAEIDGAGPAQRFRSITVPQLRHTIIASSVLILVGSMTYFETILLLTGGGPGTATRILPLHMYLQGFSAFRMGYASAIAVLLVLIGTGLSLLVVRVSGYARMTSEREGA
ncbi:carbohydrate ABC transporter permease [Actinorugispora endophytica]|uniref:Carbohydrate ABC transporter membrane protein 1 (CUT1 family) n=1 Tax=Actinorugispora endophytica TaxID=1605990 RepID=A0A4R6UUE0_9ACTN|nr:sugar ABC transporter permease [Actinorugispora endophytica]TDQ50782.1 carbohydrate ABC transporter membrane protein 1 (CUT1 family) [Actinorugispora endophytica]